MGNDVCCYDDNYYPYGTSLSFDDDMVDDLGAENLARGDVVEIRGYAFVDSKSSHETSDGAHKSIRLQLTSLKLERENDDHAKQLYGEKS